MREIDFAHAARTDGGTNFVATKMSACLDGHLLSHCFEPERETIAALISLYRPTQQFAQSLFRSYDLRLMNALLLTTSRTWTLNHAC